MSEFAGKRGLAAFAARAQTDPFFLGSVLAAGKEAHGWDTDHLAEHLRIRVDQLPRLMACRAPLSDAPSFQNEIRKIAEFAGCDPDRLLQIIREMSVLTVLRGPDTSSEVTQQRAGLLAARDHDQTSLADNSHTRGERE